MQQRRNNDLLCWSLRTLLYTAALLVAVCMDSYGVDATTRPRIFAVITGAWSDCRPVNSTQACYRRRDVACVRRTDNATAPWYYCTEVDLERPHALERCAGNECVQDCAVTEWTSWSSCDNCSAGFYRSRTREIVLPPRNGGQECPALMEREKCINCFLENRPFETLPRTYTWRTGEWRTCTTLNEDANCGHGLQTRTVECVDTEGRLVNNSFCVSEEAAYLHVFPPATTRLCDVPCQCEVEDWSPWSQCMANCSSSPLTGYRRRTRSILREPTLGETCPRNLEETELCTNYVNECPSYSWEVSGWSPCRPQSQGATCGAGLRNRFAYCVERREGGVSMTVDSSLCESSERPSTLASCEIPCHQDCVVGVWSDWSECDNACVTTYRNRTRPVLLPPLTGGDPCPHLIEHKACPVVPCRSWVIKRILSGDCFPHDSVSDCGLGTRTLSIGCVDYNGDDVVNSECTLPPPSNQEDCYKPCADGCVLTEWSDWSECSQTCDDVIGTQSRQRKIAYQGTSCPLTENDLIETRNCSEPRPCVEDIYYILEDPWGACINENQLVAGSSSYCGVGVQNRTATCMKGDNVISPEECPIPYSEMQQRSCNMPCEPACEYSEWTAYSECSAVCGGEKNRTRRLLRYPDDVTVDCMVDDDGFQTETTPCEDSTPCPTPDTDYAWYSSEYGECVLFPSVSASGANVVGECGYGYKDRNVTCRHLFTNTLVVVEDERCLGIEDKPSTVASCQVACPDHCIVTEWTDFFECTADNNDQHRSRDIIPCSRNGNLNECCPKLSSLQLSETVPCNHPDLDRYLPQPTSIYGECIISDPNEYCGNGFRYVSYTCVDILDDHKVVPEDFCRSKLGSFAPRQGCTIFCDTDCEMSEWSAWGACSTTCGRGLRRRTRTVVDDQDENGRPCGATEQVDICEATVCPYAEFVPGPFANCILNNSDSNSTCGLGMQTRQADCLIDGQPSNSEQCELLGATITFDLSEPCEVPCSGNCILSEWGAWSTCQPNSMGTWQQSRTRDKLRNCPSDVMTRDYRSCRQYAWRADNWTDCIIPSVNPGDIHPNFYCGNGTKRRNISCTDVQTSLPVHDQLCEGLSMRPVQLQNCAVPCPVDCVVGTFSEWTECQRTCMEHNQDRERVVLVAPMNGGRSCPTLRQERPCPVNCDRYVYESGHPRCSADYSDETQCGSSLQSKPISCRRNDVFVSPSECVNAVRQGLPVVGLNSTLVDRNTPSYCSTPCPVEPSCNFTDWSESADCQSSCYDEDNLFSFRTRKLIRSFESSTNSCLASQYEYANCPTVEPEQNGTSVTPSAPSECVSFSWQFSSWQSDDTRDVWCESDGARVTGGCPFNLMPLTNRDACLNRECTSWSTCDVTSGLCQCLSGSEKVEDVCLPLSGCFDDSHCLVPNMQCNMAVNQCGCSPGYQLKAGVCTLIPTTPPAATTTTDNDLTTGDSTTVATTDAPLTTVGDTGDAAANFGILEIVLVAIVPLVVVILTVIILIFITYMCRVSMEKKSEASSKRRRATLSISSPSPCPQTQEEMNARLNRRGAESASSGFVDDLENDLHRYGMPGNSFIASQHSKHSESNDEDVFAPPNHLPLNPIPVVAPTIPAANPLHHHHGNYHPHEYNESNLDNRVFNHQIVTTPGTPFTINDNYPDGDFTATDVTYTTDEGSVTGTSVPPSSVGGSPNIMRRGGRGGDVPHHLLRSPDRFRSSSRGTENQYVDMQGQPIYASIKRGGRHHDYHHHKPHPQEYHEDYRRARSGRSHDQSREHSQELSEPDYARSITPTSPSGRYHPAPQSPTHVRDTRITAGLDNAMVRAAAQMEGPHSQEEQVFQRSYHRSSGGSRRSSRRRRRRHHRNYGNQNPHHNTYHPSSRHDDYYYHHHDDGHYHRQPVTRHYSEGDPYYHSDHDPQAVYPSPGPHYPPSRSVPMTPVIPPGHQIPPHLHSPAVVHSHDPVAHHGVIMQGHPPPHSPVVAPQGGHQYSHDPHHHPNIAVQPPTPANGRREDIQATSQCSLPVTTPYQHYQPGGGYNGPPPDQGYPQSTSTPNLPTHMVPQASPHLNSPPGGRDSYENYDFPRKVHAEYTSRQEQLREEATTPTSSHYAYPRSFLSSTSSVGGVPASPTNPAPPQSHADQYNHQPLPDSASTPIVGGGHTPQTTPYTSVSLTTPQSVTSEPVAVNAQTGSPYVVRRQHHTSPLVLHSSSSNSPATSSVYTPRGSAEVPQHHLSDTLSSMESPGGVAVMGEEREHQTSLNGGIHVQYRLHHQVEANGSVPVAVQQ